MIDRYANLDSPLHSLDPRWKLLSLFILILVCASVNSPPAVFFAAGAAVIIIILSRVPVRFVFHTLKAPFILLIVMIFFLVITSGGRPLFSLAFITVYIDGLRMAAIICIKALSIMLIFIALFGTSRLNIIMKALSYFGFPRILTGLLLSTYRYIFLSFEDLEKLFVAARLRGLTLRKGIGNIGTTVNILATLLVRSYEQSERTYVAMYLRGFSGEFRTLEEFKAKPIDHAKGSALLIVSALVLFLEYFLRLKR